jgi:hypothetical protein
MTKIKGPGRPPVARTKPKDLQWESHLAAGGLPCLESHPYFFGATFLLPPFSVHHRHPLITVAPYFLDGCTDEKLIDELFVEPFAVDG